MPVGTEIARLTRALDDLVAGVHADLRAKKPMSDSDRRGLKNEIETCMQKLDELRTSLSK